MSIDQFKNLCEFHKVSQDHRIRVLTASCGAALNGMDLKPSHVARLIMKASNQAIESVTQQKLTPGKSYEILEEIANHYYPESSFDLPLFDMDGIDREMAEELVDTLCPDIIEGEDDFSAHNRAVIFLLDLLTYTIEEMLKSQMPSVMIYAYLGATWGYSKCQHHMEEEEESEKMMGENGDDSIPENIFPTSTTQH